MQYYALFYHLVDDYLTRRPMYRDNHLQLAKAAHERGELVLAGAMADPADQALLVFYVSDPSVIEAFARNDPYVINGLVASWQVRPWTVVIGNKPTD
jgi:uncharacterized protein YciI